MKKWILCYYYTFIVANMSCQATLKTGFYIFFPIVIHPSLSFFVFFMTLDASVFVIWLAGNSN